MQAFLESGVLDGAPDDVVLCIHEGVLNPGEPIDAGLGELIPGAPSVPEHGGSMVGRIAYFAELAGPDMVPVVVSEAYLQAYGDEGEAARRAMWMDEFYSQLWYVLAFCPFTHSPTKQWDDQDYSGMYPRLLPYMADVAGRQNATRPEGKPEQTVEQFVWERALELAPTNTEAALQKVLVASGQYMPYGRERWQKHEPSGDVYAIQPAIDWATDKRAAAFARVPDWGNVRVITGPGGEQPQPTLFSAPVGTAEERESGVIWPGDWVDANPFLNLYTLGGKQVYHTGADLNLNTPYWNADKDAPIYAAADGVVIFAQRVPSPSTWGRLVVIRHGEHLHTRYAHMATMLVQQNQTVRAGEPIGTIGGAEFGLADHLHFDVSHSGVLEADPRHWPGSNLQGVIDNYLPPLDFLLENGGKPEPPKDTIDLLPYLMGAHGHSHEMQYNLGGKTGTHPLQMQHDGQSFYIVKGWSGEYESLYYDDAVIYRDVDTSEAPNRFYVQRTIEDGKEYDGAPWAARHMAVGDTFHRQPRVVHFWQDTCKVRLQGDPASTLTLLAHHDSLTFSRTGITVEDVVVLSWSGGERYFFARGESLVGFEVGSGWSYISERHNRSLSRNRPPCYVALPRYWR
jgi:murein DD-endopeptidase MepM/ murein hydrolase activator NlpD